MFSKPPLDGLLLLVVLGLLEAVDGDGGLHGPIEHLLQLCWQTGLLVWVPHVDSQVQLAKEVLVIDRC